jgi:hypothetical protein
MTWANRRKLFIVLLFILAAIPFVAYVTYPFLTVEPTCSDGVQNADENGIDCGGACQYLCKESLAPLSVDFARPIQLRPGVYSAVAYVTNANPYAYVSSLSYSLELYDANNTFITERKGTTYILPGRTTAIVETQLETGLLTPSRAHMVIDAAPLMQDIRRFNHTILTVSDKQLKSETSLPKLEAVITNASLEKVSQIEVAAVIFDVSGNVKAVSKTVVKSIDGESSQRVVFTWPDSFQFTVGKIDVLPRVKPL